MCHGASIARTIISSLFVCCVLDAVCWYWVRVVVVGSSDGGLSINSSHT